MKNVVSIFVAFVFVLTSTSYVLANWKYQKDVDDFDGIVEHHVSTEYYSEGDSFAIVVFCSEYQIGSRTVIFGIRNILDPVSKKMIRLRFDSNEPEYLHVEYRDGIDHDFVNTKSIRDFKNLTDKMKKHKIMKLEFFLYNGRKIETINLSGFSEQFNRLPSYCQ